MRHFILPLVVLLAGCSGPEYSRPDWGSTGEPWDTTYLLDADPADVDLDRAALSAEAHYWGFSQVEGVLVESRRSDRALDAPDAYANGGDSGIYTGTALAAWSFKWGVTGELDDLEKVHRTLRAVWLLTHAPGPGVLCRIVFPISMDVQFDFPGRWGHRIEGGFVGDAVDVADPVLGGTFPPVRYYTRATKDQLTGLLLGLSVCWKIVGPGDEKVRTVIRQCARDIYDHLVKHDWLIRDEHGKNDTNADHVDALQKTQLLALLAQTDPPEFRDLYLDEFQITDLGDLFNRFSNWTQYYAWNLRYSRALSVWILDEDPERREEVADYIDDCWDLTENQLNAWFASVQHAASGDKKAASALTDSLKMLGLKPMRNYSSPYIGQLQEPNFFEALFGLTDKYVLPPHLRKGTGYSTWQKKPWDVGSGTEVDKQPVGDDTGLSFLLPYWAGRYFGALD